MISMQHTQPPVKLPPPPRAVRHRHGSALGIWLRVAVLALILVLINQTLFQQVARLFVRSHGKLVTATVDGKYIRRTSGHRSKVDLPYLHFTYPFEATTFNDEQQVRPQTYGFTDVGQKLNARAMRLGPFTISALEVEDTGSVVTTL